MVPAIYIVAASLIAIDLLISPKTRPNTWPGLVIVLAGVPVYFLWRKHQAAVSVSGRDHQSQNE